MSFGFGVGDIINCSKLAVSTYNALKDAPAEFEGLRYEVLSLNSTLRTLAEEASSPTSIILSSTPQRQESLRVLLENCMRGLRQLEMLVLKYPSLGPRERVKLSEHIKFAASSRQGPRDKLAIHTASINIFLTSLTHSSLGRLEQLMKKVVIASAEGNSTWRAQDDGFTASWNTLGRGLALDGLRASDIERYGSEVQAYFKHLVRGGKPFWKSDTLPAQTNPPPAYYNPGSYKQDQQQAPGSLPLPAFGHQPYSSSAPPNENPSPSLPGSYPDSQELPASGNQGAHSRPENFYGGRPGASQQNQSSSLFGAAPYTRPESELQARLSNDAGRKKKTAEYHHDEIDAMINLFDHMFDVDEKTMSLSGTTLPDDTSSLTEITPPLTELTPPLPPRPQFSFSPPTRQPDYFPPSSHTRHPSGPEVTAGWQAPANDDSNTTIGRVRPASMFIQPTTNAITPDSREKDLDLAVRDLHQLLRMLRSERSGSASSSNKWDSVLWKHTLPRNIKRVREFGGTVIQCDLCDLPVEDEHYHCSLCHDGDYDLCSDCWDAGRKCGGATHILIPYSAKVRYPSNYWSIEGLVGS